MIVAKTLKVKLLLTNEDIVLINESVKEFTRICNEVSKFIYENNFILNSKFLVTNLYQKFKNESILTTSMIQTTFRTVIDSYKKATWNISQKNRAITKYLKYNYYKLFII